MRPSLLALALLLVACGQTYFNPLPPCFPLCGGGGGGGSWNPPPEVRSLEVVLLRETVEASPGTSASLPLWIRLQGNPPEAHFSIYLIVRYNATGSPVLGNRTVAMRGNEEREEEISFWVDSGWSPGDYRLLLVAIPLGYSEGPVSRPFTLRVR